MSVILMLSGTALAGAKGHVMPQGFEIVICSGVGVTTLTVGPDGEPVEQVELCPEGHSTFVAIFEVPVIAAPTARLLVALSPAPVHAVAARHVPDSSARGPPVQI